MSLSTCRESLFQVKLKPQVLILLGYAEIWKKTVVVVKVMVHPEMDLISFGCQIQ